MIRVSNDTSKVIVTTTNRVSGVAQPRGVQIRKSAAIWQQKRRDRDDVLDAGALDNATTFTQGTNSRLVLLRESQRLGGSRDVILVTSVMLTRYFQSPSRDVQRVLTCAIVITESSRMTRCAHETGHVLVKSSALYSSVRGTIYEAAESRMQITSVVSGFALDLCTGAVTLRGNGFAAGTSSARDAVRRASSRSTTHLSNFGKRQ